MAARVGVEAEKGDHHKLRHDAADQQPAGWVQRTKLPWAGLMENVWDLDTVAGDTDRAEIHKQYFATSKPFKTQGSFQRCPDLLQKFAKDEFAKTDLMWTKVTPGRVPYAENGRPMSKESTVADYIAKHMGTTKVDGPISYGNVPLYVFTGIETFMRQAKPHNYTRSTGHKEKGKVKAKWYKMWRSIHRCMSQSVGWFKDFRHFDDGRWWTIGLGSGGSGAPHHAHAAAVNLGVVGHKLWHVYPPAVSNYTSDPVALWQNRREAGATVQPVSFVQHPGDLVFVPANWAHSTMNLGDTVSFSAVLPNSMAGVDIEPESLYCHLGRDGQCQYLDPHRLGHLALIDTGSLADPQRPFDKSDDVSLLDEPPKKRPRRMSRSHKRHKHKRRHHTLR